MLRGEGVACLLLGVLFGAVGCGVSQTCTHVDCLSGVSIDGQIAGKYGDIIEVEFCLNDHCAKSSTSVSGACVDLGGIAGDAGSAVNAVSVGVCIGQGSGSGTMPVSGGVSLGPGQYMDGDHYVLTFTDTATGSVVGLVDQHVHYSVNQPNGPKCAPTCRNAGLTVAPP